MNINSKQVQEIESTLNNYVFNVIGSSKDDSEYYLDRLFDEIYVMHNVEMLEELNEMQYATVMRRYNI